MNLDLWLIEMYFYHSHPEPGDYTQTMAIFTFSPSATEFILTVPIINDDLLEAIKLFSVRAELLTTDATGVMIDPEQSDVTIIDEDRTYKNS